jgi:hypothetical protein
MAIFQISASVILLAVSAVVAYKALAGLSVEIKRLEAEEAE